MKNLAITGIYMKFSGNVITGNPNPDFFPIFFLFTIFSFSSLTIAYSTASKATCFTYSRSDNITYFHLL